jgi:hypothetical protein
MGELDKEMSDLLEKTRRTRYQFLKAELQTCFTALDMAKYELSIGNVDVVEKEVRFVEEGVRTIKRFLGETSLEQGREIDARLANLQGSLDLVKAKLMPAS